jgi:hypothetical protein
MGKRSRTDDFTDAQRAEIYARDRAICAYSGKSLWLLDFGAGPSSGEWVDHVKAVARSGKPTIENGVCASWLYNSVKREHGRAMMLFHAGYPTADFFTFFESVPESIAEHLTRFSLLHHSDWYFNRALSKVIIGAAQIGERRVTGSEFSRTTAYYAASAFSFFEKWRDLSADVASLRQRGLRPNRPSDDQALLLLASRAESPKAIETLIRKLAPYTKASWTALGDLAYLGTAKAARDHKRKVLANKHVVPRVKRAVRRNVDLLLAAWVYE